MTVVAREDDLIPVLAALCENPNHERIAQLAGTLALIAIFSKAAEFNVGRKVGKTKGLAALRQLHKKIDQTISHILDLGTEPRMMLDKSLTLEQDTDTNASLDALVKLANASASAHRLIQSQPYTPAKSAKPRKSASRAVAERAYDIYRELTGNTPTIPSRDGQSYGPFLEFLSNIFYTLEITASPEAAGREAIKEKRPPATE